MYQNYNLGNNKFYFIIYLFIVISYITKVVLVYV